MYVGAGGYLLSSGGPAPRAPLLGGPPGDYIQDAGQENAKFLVIEGASWLEIGALRGLWL